MAPLDRLDLFRRRTRGCRSAVAGRRAGDAVIAMPLRHVLLGDRQHAAGTAAGVVDGQDFARAADFVFVPGQQQIDHQMNHVPRREVLAGILVQRLVELAQQFFEDGAHCGVVDRVRMQVDGPEALHDQKEQPGVIEPGEKPITPADQGDGGKGAASLGLGCIAGGAEPQQLPDGFGRTLKKGSTILFNMHYYKQPGVGSGYTNEAEIGSRVSRNSATRTAPRVVKR